MNDIKKSEICAKALVDSLIPYLPPSSADVKDDYDAGEYIAAARGAIHDLGILRADITEQLLREIEMLLTHIETEDDEFNLKYMASMKIGFNQLKDRWALVNDNQSA